MPGRRQTSFIALLFVYATCAGCGGPTKPSDGATLVVRAIDQSTGQPIASDIYGIAVTIQGPATSTMAIANGRATFRALPRGTYAINSHAEYGYDESAAMTVTVDGDQTVTLSLKPIDDAVVTEVFVEGVGAIGKGAIINVPPTGIDFRIRGKYQSIANPWQLTYVIVEMLSPDGRAYGASICCVATHTVFGPNDFEYSIRGWVPCSGTFCSDTDALNVKLHYFPPGAFFSTVLRNKAQPWPLVFRNREKDVQLQSAPWKWLPSSSSNGSDPRRFR
jgi:hypothetical protein